MLPSGSDLIASLITMTVFIAICIGLFLLFRRFVLWYWGVTRIHELQERQAIALEQIRDTVATAARRDSGGR